MEERILIETTRERAQAMAAAMAHEHISYTDDGQRVKGFLGDLDAALSATVNSVDGGRLFWGVIGPSNLPVLYGPRESAEEDRDSDERVALFSVAEVNR